MARHSAGILLYRRVEEGVEVLLAHPGGPFWAKKDAGAWSLPKGEHEAGEDALAAARREFAEETGLALAGPFADLGEVTQSSGKVVRAWACRGDFDPARLSSNTFEMEWPPRSGKRASFVEVDRVAWFAPAAARGKLVSAQVAFVERLVALLGL